jgi:hypothetical protein
MGWDSVHGATDEQWSAFKVLFPALFRIIWYTLEYTTPAYENRSQSIYAQRETIPETYVS